MILDPEIELAGVPCEIVRTGGNLTTYIVSASIGRVAGKFRANPEEIHQNGYLLPTDCGAVIGDLFLKDGEYYLLMTFEKMYDNGEHSCYRGQLFKCNSVVDVYYYSDATKKHTTLHESGVHCLITQSRLSEINEDKAYMMRDYRGRTQPFNFYAQESCGILGEGKTIIVDQDSRRFRVLKDFNPFIADNILTTAVEWEN